VAEAIDGPEEGGASFGTRLRRARLAAGLTQEALAERAGLSARGIQDLERGLRATPQRQTVRLLSRALGLAPGAAAALEATVSRARRPGGPGPAGRPGSARGWLPWPLTSFVGRERELAAVRQLLGQHRLVTLTGPGGVGKTRLALQAAADALGADGAPYPDGVWLVELAALADPGLVLQAVAATVGVREEPGRPLVATLAAALRPRRLLLVLDNCEHLVGACARSTDGLLRACPELRVLATSREALGVAGEARYPVLPLALPEPPEPPEPPDARHPTSLGVLARAEAVRLFVERATAIQPAFAITAQNARPIAEICRRLDGLPLALELAAARVPVLGVEALLARLGDRFRLLTGGSRTALPRQQTLWATVDWSYGLLGQAERRLFRRLAVFAGGWTLEAAEAVGAGEDLATADVLDLLAGLVDKSLVAAEAPTRDGRVRYRLLETLRQYGQKRLRDAGEAAAARGRHLAWAVALAEEAGPGLRGPQQAGWVARLETEHDNLRAAVRWATERGEAGDAGAAQQGLQLAWALGYFWHIQGPPGEGHAALTALLRLPGAAVRTAARARALAAASHMAWFVGDPGCARARAAEALAIARELGDRQTAARALECLGRVATYQDRYADALPLVEESLRAWQELGDEWSTAGALHLLGYLAFRQGDPAAGRTRLEEALALWRRVGDRIRLANTLQVLGLVADALGDPVAARARLEEGLAIERAMGRREGIGWTLAHLGEVARAQGDHPAARALLEESLAIRRDVGYRRPLADSLRGLAEVAHEQGDPAAARGLYREAVAILRDLGDRTELAAVLEGFAALAAGAARPEQAVRLAGAAAALRSALGTRPSRTRQAEVDRWLEPARSDLSDPAFDAAWAAGQAMTLEQAVADALEEAQDEA
jgi:non-specific serine/threonine protein kinase